MGLINCKVEIIKNNFFPSNTYIVINNLTKESIIIDPGLDKDEIQKKINLLSIKPVGIIATHGHFDHVGSAYFFKEKYRIPFYLHEADFKILKSANFYLKIANLENKIKIPEPDFFFKKNKELLTLAGFSLEIYNFPGHSPGSCCIKIDDFLFSGDILYKNGLGLPTIPRADKKLLKQSIIMLFKTFNSNIIAFPGHGAQEFVGLIEQNNNELKKFLLE